MQSKSNVVSKIKKPCICIYMGHMDNDQEGDRFICLQYVKLINQQWSNIIEIFLKYGGGLYIFYQYEGGGHPYCKPWWCFLAPVLTHNNSCCWTLYKINPCITDICIIISSLQNLKIFPILFQIFLLQNGFDGFIWILRLALAVVYLTQTHKEGLSEDISISASSFRTCLC